MADEAALREMFSLLCPHLDERQRRLLVGAQAKLLGRGGMTLVSAVAGVSMPTVRKAIRELESGSEPLGRARRPGGGRKRLRDKDPELPGALEALVDPESRGDPESPLRWTTKSTRQLGRALEEAGHPASHHAGGRDAA